MLLRSFLLPLAFVAASPRSKAADGYMLWQKYDLITDVAQRNAYRQAAQYIAVEGSTSAVLRTAVSELQRGLQGLLDQPVPLVAQPQASSTNRGISLIVSPTANVAGITITQTTDGYRISSQGRDVVLTGRSGAGVLYGVYALLRHLQTGQSLANLTQASNPRIQYRLLNHWDNPNGTVERGYAGSSIWKWYELPERLDPRYTDYARANASIGINRLAINNVNASARYLTPEYLQKVKALAGVFRP
ncbi:alpha-glucuronidase family glycosyl hydrolase [Hymenobacter artigasi]|uniref:Alpha-glucuronidase n=1 Tax=Hymenobacter artigasi TaxID=2719616 RepID=A0ABX1HH86_9BACT|nr:alpha-glucuronidase family glycosyl hydrolase [Hymenobacter artigasi]NKI89623.1 alpha-glucuronidase [Hymenobacter artigasi]